jgi:hypothetical protein
MRNSFISIKKGLQIFYLKLFSTPGDFPSGGFLALAPREGGVGVGGGFSAAPLRLDMPCQLGDGLLSLRYFLL